MHGHSVVKLSGVVEHDIMRAFAYSRFGRLTRRVMSEALKTTQLEWMQLIMNIKDVHMKVRGSFQGGCPSRVIRTAALCVRRPMGGHFRFWSRVFLIGS